MRLHDRPLWVFDLDGTLTVPNHDFDAIRDTLGIPPGRLILEYLDELPAAQSAPLHARLLKIERALAGETRAAPGCQALLRTLRGRRIRLAILTRNTRENALLTLERLGVLDCFDPADVLGRDNAPHKPDPAGLLAIARRHGIEAADCAMLGDNHLDLRTGRNAGCMTVHVARYSRGRWPGSTDLFVAGLEALMPDP